MRDRLAHYASKLRRHFAAGQVPARDADGPSGHFIASREQLERDGANVGRGDARQLCIADRQNERQFVMHVATRTHAVVDEVVPVEHCAQVRRRQLREEVVGLALAVVMRNFVLAL